MVTVVVDAVVVMVVIEGDVEVTLDDGVEVTVVVDCQPLTTGRLNVRPLLLEKPADSRRVDQTLLLTGDS